ncbi:hypothetical protein I3842_07G055200 [Carya illinoinensis]|uniref:Uncharacterized protein n=1 Tax=Carya illinoinensis TaxID=32201 RepID=A0A922JEE7_CARIL|nr:hypothetical protein I3842_07G055200 [Carya illinoinensis]
MSRFREREVEHENIRACILREREREVVYCGSCFNGQIGGFHGDQDASEDPNCKHCSKSVAGLIRIHRRRDFIDWDSQLDLIPNVALISSRSFLH